MTGTYDLVLGGALSVSDMAALHHLFRRAFQLSRRLPDALLLMGR